MRVQELLDVHKRVMDAYLHQHKLSWELVGIGWATNVGLLTILLTVFSKSAPIPVETSIVLLVISSVTNLFWWFALIRREIYKEAFAFQGVQIEQELSQIGVDVNIFRTRKFVREEKRDPIKKTKLRFYQSFASTAPSRYSFILMMIFWSISVALLSR